MDAPPVSLPALIRRKRDGERLRDEEIQSFVRGVTEGSAQQGQIGAGTAGPGGHCGDLERDQGEAGGGWWRGDAAGMRGAGGG